MTRPKIVPPSSTFDFSKISGGYKAWPTNGYIRHTWTLERGGWDEGLWETDPYVTLHVGSGVLNYGQAAFEGLKAYRSSDGTVRLFRPDENAKRLNYSADMVSMPEVPEEMFMKACETVVAKNLEFVPPHEKNAKAGSLYVRPLLFGSGPSLAVKPPDEYTFLVYVSPVGPLYIAPDGLDAFVTETFDRTAPLGTGSAKLGGNYAPVFKHTALARKAGYSVTLHLDSQTRKNIDEFSTANFLAITYHKDHPSVYANSHQANGVNGHDSTPKGASASTKPPRTARTSDKNRLVVPTSTSILKSVTTKSLVHLVSNHREFRDEWEVEKRTVPFEDVVRGEFDEVAAAGTAAIVTPLRSISYHTSPTEIAKIAIGPFPTTTTAAQPSRGREDSAFSKIVGVYTSIMSGDREDEFGWMWPREGIEPQ